MNRFTPQRSLRLGAALATSLGIALVTVVGALPACFGHEPLLDSGDAGVDTCTPNGGACTARNDVIELQGPCGLEARQASNLSCPTSFVHLATPICCIPKRTCTGSGTCDYEGVCDGAMLTSLLCENGRTCCGSSTAFDAGVVQLEQDGAADAPDGD